MKQRGRAKLASSRPFLEEALVISVIVAFVVLIGRKSFRRCKTAPRKREESYSSQCGAP